MTKYTLKSEQSACRFIDREAVLINAETSAYYSLNQTGSYVLRELVVAAKNSDEIAQSIADYYDAAPAQHAQDVDAAISRLLAEGLILKSEKAQNAQIEGAEDVALPENYESPNLERHGELEQLILSGE